MKKFFVDPTSDITKLTTETVLNLSVDITPGGDGDDDEDLPGEW